MRIDPTPGRVVWYKPGDEDEVSGTPGTVLAAMVAKVLPDGRVNLLVVDENGRTHSRQGVTLRQEDDDPPADGKSFCEWMPYQIGQAKKQADPPPATSPETDLSGEQAIPEDVPVTDDLSQHPKWGRKKK